MNTADLLTRTRFARSNLYLPSGSQGIATLRTFQQSHHFMKRSMSTSCIELARSNRFSTEFLGLNKLN